MTGPTQLRHGERPVSERDKRRGAQAPGEYYTPDWLAEAMVKKIVTDPLNLRVLDPACGSGTFLRAAIVAYAKAAAKAGTPPAEALAQAQSRVIGIDVHPVAVHLARVTWVLAAKDLIRGANGSAGERVSVPVYLGDSLQLHTDAGSLLGSHEVVIETDPAVTGKHMFLRFPRSLVARGDEFDALLLSAARDIEYGIRPEDTLDAFGMVPGPDRDTMTDTLRAIKELHIEGRNHIWAYFTRNLVRPVWLSTDDGKVDRIVGNPPWLTYNKTVSSIRQALERQAKHDYGIWPKPKYATHTDLAGLFYHPLLRPVPQCGRPRRDGDAALDPRCWPVRQMAQGCLEENSRRPQRQAVGLGTAATQRLLPRPGLRRVLIQDHLGQQTASPQGPAMARKAGGPNTRKTVPIAAGAADSPYGRRARQGATIVPRRLFFVTATPAEQAPGSSRLLVKGKMDVVPLRSKNEKNPWKELELPALASNRVSGKYVHDIHRGDTIAAHTLLPPVQAVLPIAKGADKVPTKKTSASNPRTAEIHMTFLDDRMRERWRDMTDAWEAHKARPTNSASSDGWTTCET